MAFTCCLAASLPFLGTSGPLDLWPFGPLAFSNKKAIVPDGSRRLAPVSDILMDKPGYAIATEGFHELSVDVMNTSFSLVSHKYSIQTK